jgi:hypothetical protein
VRGIGIERNNDKTFPSTAVKNLRISRCCQPFVAHVDGFNAFIAKV